MLSGELRGSLAANSFGIGQSSHQTD